MAGLVEQVGLVGWVIEWLVAWVGWLVELVGWLGWVGWVGS